jgi:predicted transcriptional regulator
MLKLRLVDDDKVLWEIPLEAEQWDRRRLQREFDEMDQEIQRFESLFNAMANRSRMRMMRTFFVNSETPIAFTELMRILNLNPKIVSDSTKRLRSTGLIEKNREGKYQSTRLGEAQFLMMSVAMKRMLEFLEEI